MYAVGVFGDSITLGRGNNIDRGWCGRLRKEFEAKDYYNILYNLGIPDNTSTNLLKRMPTECETRFKKIREGDKIVLVIAIGINDVRYLGSKDNPQTTIEQFKENIKGISTIANNYADKVTFIGLTPVDEEITLEYEGTQFFNERIIQFNQVIEEHCKEEELQFINLTNVWDEANLKEVLDDGLHPNSKGYELLFNHIKQNLIL